jgi:hypothetical protein
VGKLSKIVETMWITYAKMWISPIKMWKTYAKCGKAPVFSPNSEQNKVNGGGTLLLRSSSSTTAP